MSKGRILYLQEEYDEALKYLREKDHFEIMLIESIRITPKDKSTNDYIRSPQLTLIERSLLTGNFIKIAEFLRESSNDFVKKLVNIILKNKNMDLNLLSDLNERERAIAWYYLLVSDLPREYKKVRRFIEEHIGFCKMVGDLYHEACMLDLLGTVYLSTGHFDKAYEIYEKSLEIFKEFDDHHRIASIKNHIALMYYFRQDPENCLKLSKQALEIHERMKYRSGIAMAKALMGLAYFIGREYNMALKLLDEAIQFFRRQYPTRFALLAVYRALIYRYIKLYDEALKLLKEAEKIFKEFEWLHHEEAVITHKSIIYLEERDVNKARIYLSNALKRAKNIGDYSDIVTILLNLIRATDGKEEYINEVLKYYKAWRSSLFSLDTIKDVLSSHDFRVVIDALLSSNNVVKAYEAHLELKNRTAIDIFGAEVISENLIGDEGARRLKEVEKKVRSAERLLDLGLIREARREASEIIEDKKIVVYTYLDVKGDDEIIDFHFGEKTGYFHRKRFKEIQFRNLREFVEELLKDEAVKSALLEVYKNSGIKGNQIRIDVDWVYIIYENGKYWWAKLNKQDDLLRLLNDILLACLIHPSHLAYERINEYRIELNPDEERYRLKQSNHYQEVAERILRYFGEAFEDLFSYDEIIIASAYPLMNFPYHLIMGSDGKTLIEAANVKYVPHAGVAKRLKERKVGMEKMEKASVIYTDIPWAGEEAEKITSIIPDSEVINATNVNKKVVLSMIRKDAKILHFACHAVVVPKAQYSYLSLSDDPKPPEPNLRLYLSDLLSLRLNDLSLVCMSACGTGRYENAIDTLGFPLAFFAKGAKNVIATQWVVYGRTAKEFFTRFYDILINGNEVYEAYRSTMLEIKKKKKAMFYWGPFVYYGV